MSGRLYDGLSSSMEIGERLREYDRFMGEVPSKRDPDEAYERERDMFSVVRIIDKIKEGAK